MKNLIFFSMILFTSCLGKFYDIGDISIDELTVSTGDTYAEISFSTNIDTLCTTSVEGRPAQYTTGTEHSMLFQRLEPEREYSFVISARITEDQKVYSNPAEHRGTFITTIHNNRTDLESLEIRAGEDTFNLLPQFTGTHREYSVVIDNQYTDIEIVPVPVDLNAIMIIDNNLLKDGDTFPVYGIAEGLNSIEILVSSNDSLSVTRYSLKILRQRSDSRWEGDYDIWDQGDIDALAGYTEVTGSLNIDSTSLGSIKGLEALSVIGGDLYILNNTELRNTDGLDGLVNVVGYVYIEYNDFLDNFNSMANLETVGRSFRVAYNPLLTSIDGLLNFTEIGKSLYIYFYYFTPDYYDKSAPIKNIPSNKNNISRSLPQCNGKIFDHLWIENNQSLNNLNGLINVTSIGSDLEVSAPVNFMGKAALNTKENVQKALHNKGLLPVTDFTGIRNIRTIGGTLYIYSVDNFTDLEVFSNITFVGSSVRIENNSNLLNLNGLNNIIISGGLLISQNPILKNLQGLNNVEVYGRMEIKDNASFESLSGSESLTVYNNIIIESNNALTNLNGFNDFIINDNIDLFIKDNQKLQNIDGLSNLFISDKLGSFHLENNPMLTDLSPLNNLNTVNGDLNIVNNDTLDSLDGFSHISHVYGDIRIENNNSIYNTDSLNNLSSFNSLFIENNDSLRSINGFNNVNGIVTGRITIKNNSNLTEINGFNNITEINQPIYIGYNASLNIISGFQNIEKSGNINIRNNPKLLEINAFNILTDIIGYFILTENTNLNNISSINSIEYVSEHLSISYCNLFDLNNFNKLSIIENSLSINDNYTLDNLGFTMLKRVGKNVRITYNFLLSTSKAWDLVYQLENYDEIGIYINNNLE